MSKKSIAFLIISLVIGCLFVLRACHFGSIDSGYQKLNEVQPFHYNGKQFAGSQSCIPCHESIYKTHTATAHFNTSARANGENLQGSFNGEQDRINLVGSQVKLVAESEDYFQVTKSYPGKILDKSKIDVVIGSGVKGQSHLTFKGDSLYQLQVSYFKLTNGWVNSPGFPNQRFQRPVMDNCIKCHVTFAKNEDVSGMSNVYDKDSFIYGVDCERCHGPSQEHVDFRKGNLKLNTADPIVQIDTLSRNLRDNICAQCHAGLRANQLKNPFSYVVGEKLEEYSKNYNTRKPEYELDVHGNQYGLLKSSACYKNSPTMSCTTCHDSHLNQREQENVFNGKCMECHKAVQHPHETEMKSSTAQYDNCIKCHMPVFPSKTMNVSLPNTNQEKAIDIRTHLIGIYIDKVYQTKP